MIINEAKENPVKFLSKVGFDNVDVTAVDITDGLRMTLSNGDIVHLRPSGNAPELRCYSESGSIAKAFKLIQDFFKKIASYFDV